MKKLKVLRKKKADKVDWRAIWKSFDRWYMEGEASDSVYDWFNQKEKIEKLVEAQLKRRKK